VVYDISRLVYTMSSDNCKDGASTKSSVCEVNDMLHSMSTTDDKEVAVSVCANCGKEGTDVTNTCNKCKEVMYCNAACKKKHRHKHKKECERRVAELHDEKLFKQPPQLEDCPICFLRLPSHGSGQVYMACCGKIICRGCDHAIEMSEGKDLCAFCRTPPPTTKKEMVKRFKERVELNDTEAIRCIGSFYAQGLHGYPQNFTKAFELYHRAAELGHAGSYNSLGNAYKNGRGIEMDKRKARHYFELAAMRGDVAARYNLACFEAEAGNFDRALKHWMIAAEHGFKKSLENIKKLYKIGHATKEDYTNALQTYQTYLKDIKSNQRDEAAVFNADWEYY